LGLGLEWAALAGSSGPSTLRSTTWSAFPWALAVTAWTAESRSRGRELGRTSLERLWFPFRDHWGVVWGIRVQERFNHSADAAGWPIRLAWHGVVPAPGGDGDLVAVAPDAAEATLKGLLRRFATEARLASWGSAAGRIP
jgi:hypothetical protein